MKYEEMSDFEINVLVADKHLRFFTDEVRSRGRLESDVWLFDSEGLVRHTSYNPCNNPSHMMPIVFKYKMSLEPHASKDTYFSSTRYCDFNHQDKNPLRAAAICFLKMKDAEGK